MTRGWSIAFWTLLALSLLGNAVAVGLWLRLADMRDSIGGGGVPAELRAAVRQALRDDLPALRGPLADLAAARRAMFAAAAARPYDRGAVEAAMARVREATAALQVAGQEALLRAFDDAASGGG